MSIDSDDLNDLAAEYVLGTLAGEERAAFEARLRHDTAAMRAVALWAQRLQPLADALPPTIPPPHLWERIRREAGLPARRSLRAPVWIAAAAAAAVLVLALMFPGLFGRPEVEAVAQLASPQGGAAAFVVSVLDDRSRLLIRAAQVSAVPNQSYELWAVPPAGAAPVSLGVVAATGETERRVAETLRSLLSPGATLAVSREPEGGSPTGTPTTVMFVGALQAPGK